MVACYGNKKVAIECDGEKYHSGEDKIREDMERQNIIERITKFNFIRIRGSEYNLNKEKSIDRIIKELNEYGIYPETSQKVLNSVNSKYPNLIEEIKIRAQQIREEWNTDEQFDIEKQNGEITTCVEKLPFY
jgi:ribosomal protein L15